MALIGRPPTRTGANIPVITTAAWSGFGRRFPADVLITKPVVNVSSRAGAQILLPGQYETTWNFSFTPVGTDVFSVRGYDAVGPGRVVSFSGEAGEPVEGSYKFFSNVTPAHLTAGNVFIFVQVAAFAGSADLTWDHSELTIQYVGAAK